MEIVDHDTIQHLLQTSGSPATIVAGGSSANTIKGLANLGHTCALVGKIGNDTAGKRFLESMAKKNIHSHHIVSTTPTGQIVCLVTPDGERTFKDFLGSGQEMRADDLKPELFQGVKLVHIEGYTILNGDLTLRAMQLAKEAKAKVSFDLACFEVVEQFKDKLMHLLENYVDIVFANAQEAMALTGVSAEESCRALHELCETAVVSLNKEGCFIANNGQKIRCHAYPVQPIDTTGAGDLFAAGILHGYLTGQPWERCAHYGALMGAEVVQVLGAEIPEERWKLLRTKIV